VVVIFHSSSKSSERSNVAAPAAPGLSAGNGHLEGRTCAKDNARIKRKVPGKHPARRMPVEKDRCRRFRRQSAVPVATLFALAKTIPLTFSGKTTT
jgi:hypothetical protein